LLKIPLNLYHCVGFAPFSLQNSSPTIALSFCVGDLKIVMPNRTRASRPGASMSEREKQTLVLLTKGQGAADIATTLNITPNYVYSMIKMLKARFDVTTINGIVARAIAEGVVTPEGEMCTEEPTGNENSAD
jgi:DNA-binding CsgD family transcriptional regulator